MHRLFRGKPMNNDQRLSSEGSQPDCQRGPVFGEISRTERREDDNLLEMGGGIAVSGSDFFYSLVEHLARAVDIHCAWVAQITSAPKPTLKTLAVSLRGKDAGNFEYTTANTPAQDIFSNSGISLYAADVQERFPEDAFLRSCAASGYAGIPLVDCGGELLGLLAVASSRPLVQTPHLASQMRSSASRAAVEIERRRADAAVRASEVRLRLIFDHAPDAFLLLTLEGKLLEANRSLERLTGFTRAEMIGRNVLIPGVMPEEDIRRAATRLRVRAAGAPASQEEFTILHRNGSRAFAETYSELVTIDGVQVMLLCVRDITSRKIGQQGRQNQIDRSQQLQNAALAFATHEVTTVRDSGQIARYVTGMVCELTDAAGASVWQFSGGANEIQCLDRFEAASGTHSGGDTAISDALSRYRDKLQESRVIIGTNIAALSKEPGCVKEQGCVPAISASAGSFLEAGIRTGKRIRGVLRIERGNDDVRTWQPEEVQFVATVSNLLGQALSDADCVGAQEDLRKNEARLERTQRTAALGTWERELTTGKMAWSDEVFRIYGVAKDCFVPAEQWFRNHVHPDDLPKIDAAINDILLTGEPGQVTFRIMRPDGSQRFVREVAEFETGPFGGPIRLTGTVQDITEIKSLEEQLQTAHRFDGIGRMTNGIAQDFGNLLTVIMGHGSLIARSPGNENVVRKGMESILGACQRASTWIQQLLAFSQSQTTVAAVRDINSIVRDFDGILRPLLGAGIEVSLTLDSDAGTVETREAEIHQILLALALDARDSMARGGRLTIETAGIRRDIEFCNEDADPGSGSWAMLTVSAAPAGGGTTGDAATQDTIGWKAAGQCMSTVNELVQRSSGKVRVEGACGKGTRVCIFLPKAEAEESAYVEESACEEDRAAEEKLRGNETILVVEDQPEVRTLARTVLESLGYKVLSAAHGDAALRISLEYRATIDLLLTDMVMPGIPGEDLANRLSQHRPALRVLFMSGYRTHSAVQKDDAAKGRGFIRKPFDPFVLAAKIRTLLGPPAVPAAILVAHGNEGVRGVTRNVLAAAGYKVFETSNAVQAEAQIQTTNIDVFIAEATIAGTIAAAGRQVIRIADNDASARDAGVMLSLPIQPDELLTAVRKILLHKT